MYKITPPPQNKIYAPLPIRDKMYLDLQNIYDIVEIGAFSDKCGSWIECKNEGSDLGMEFSFNYEGTLLEQVSLCQNEGADLIYSACDPSRYNMSVEKEKLHYPLNKYYNVQNKKRENI